MQPENNIPTRATSKNIPTPSASTQREKIVDLLTSAAGQWVPLPEIAACACQYGARIFEARRSGFRIENKTQEIDGVRRSWFRLIQSVQVEPAPAPAADRIVSINSQTKSAGDVTSDPPARQLALF